MSNPIISGPLHFIGKRDTCPWMEHISFSWLKFSSTSHLFFLYFLQKFLIFLSNLINYYCSTFTLCKYYIMKADTQNLPHKFQVWACSATQCHLKDLQICYTLTFHVFIMAYPTIFLCFASHEPRVYRNTSVQCERVPYYCACAARVEHTCVLPFRFSFLISYCLFIHYVYFVIIFRFFRALQTSTTVKNYFNSLETFLNL